MGPLDVSLVMLLELGRLSVGGPMKPGAVCPCGAWPPEVAALPAAVRPLGATPHISAESYPDEVFGGSG